MPRRAGYTAWTTVAPQFLLLLLMTRAPGLRKFFLSGLPDTTAVDVCSWGTMTTAV